MAATGDGPRPGRATAAGSSPCTRGSGGGTRANIYTNGHSEKIIGGWFAARPGLRDRVAIGTKFFANLFERDPNGGGAGRKSIVAALENSLRRLRTEYVDVYCLHNWDRTAPIEETMRAPDDLVTAGKVRYVGFSDLPVWKATQAQVTAQFRGWAPAIGLQVEYSLLERTSEGELIPMAQEHGLGVMPWSPLKSGFLSGKYSRSRTEPVDTLRGGLVGGPSEKDYDVIDVVERVAEEVGATPAAVALAWVRQQPGITSTLVGARRLDQFRANLASLEVSLTTEQIAALNAASEPTLNFPAENNRALAPSLAFAGATVDGIRTAVLPLLAASAQRY